MGAGNECIPFYEPGQRITGAANGAAVVGKRFVDVAADISSGPGLSDTAEGGNIQVEHATAAAKSFGVTSHDAAEDEKVTILGSGFVVPVTAAAAIDAGEEVEVATGGKATPLSAGVAVGLCLADAAQDEDAMILKY